MLQQEVELVPEEAIGFRRRRVLLSGSKSRRFACNHKSDNNKVNTKTDTDMISTIMSKRAHQRLFNHSDGSNSYSCSCLCSDKLIMSQAANGCNPSGTSGIEEESSSSPRFRRNTIKKTTMSKKQKRCTSSSAQMSLIRNDNCFNNLNNNTSKHKSIGKSCKLVSSLMSGAMLALVSLTLLLLATPVARQADGAKLPDIYWNSSNPIFRIDNTDHIFDVNKKLHDHDQVDLVCPSQQTANQMSSGADQDQAANKSAEAQQPQQSERYIIYSVSKDEYDTCRLNNVGQPARAVAICDQQAGKPSRPPITITFRSFTPQPNGLEFKPGQDYYFITALHGHHTDQARRFSPCRELNMKVIFKICCKSTAPLTSSGQQQQQQGLVSQTRKSASAAQQPGSQVKVQLGGQPMSRPSNVMTVRPTYKPATGQQQQQQAQPLSDYFSTLTPAGLELSNMNQHQAQQAHQPVTVLPIEVIQPASEPSSSQGDHGAQSQAQQDSQQAAGVDIKNDIQNEQPTLAHSSQQPHLNPAPRSNQQAPFVLFDPHAPPTELLLSNKGRWTPTPLPPNLTQQVRDNNAANNNAAANQQLKPAYWQLQPINQQQQQQFHQNQQHQAPPRQHPGLPRQAISEQQQQQQYQQEMALNNAARNAGPSRIGFYPWLSQTSTATADQQHQLSVSTRDLITVAQDQQQQQAGAAGAPTFAVALLVPLLALAILLALGLERRLR